MSILGAGGEAVPDDDPATAMGVDRFDPRLCLSGEPGVLRAFNYAGVLTSADVHVARRLGALGGDGDEAVLLAAALAVRAPRLGHVCTDLTTARTTVAPDLEATVDVRSLAWPPVAEWVERVSASPVVAVGEDACRDRPLRLVDTRLYLDRYWREEYEVGVDLRARSEAPAEGVEYDVLAAGLERLFPSAGGPAPDLQRLAAATAVLRRFSLVAGGPGTGKTTTVARILALLYEQMVTGGGANLRVALAAPTGKAAARLEEAVHEEARRIDVSAVTRNRLLALEASTLHRLLGWRPGSRSRFRHHRGNRLAHDVVVVDETSMVSLSLMARLLEAVRPGSRLVLVGDPEQLASVEAGAVLGDIVGPAAARLRMRPPARAALTRVTAAGVPATDPPGDATIGDGVVVLRQIHRFGGGIAALAEAVQRGDADSVLAVLGDSRPDVHWIDADLAGPGARGALQPVRRAVVDAGRRVFDAARAGDGRAALDAIGAMRVVCAHRRGAYGVATWTSHVQRWLAAELDGYGVGGRWYVGRPLLVVENDYGLRLYNGDTGVVVAREGGRVHAVFERRGGVVQISPTRLGAVETVHAMTVHKSQGSQFGAVAVLLPEADSPILTRELLYTAVTRAQRRLTVVGREESIRAAVTRPIARASGLRDRLWGRPVAGAP